MNLIVLPLLARMQAETPDVMLSAAQTRLQEAEALLSCKQWDGAVYLAGYAAEMLLKVACCRLDPAFPAGGTVGDIFGPAATLWRSLFPSGTSLPSQWKHDLSFWEDVLRARRLSLRTGVKEWGDLLLISRHLNTIRRHWRVNLRYQPPLAAEGEAQDVCEAARWLFDNSRALWS